MIAVAKRSFERGGCRKRLKQNSLPPVFTTGNSLLLGLAGFASRLSRCAGCSKGGAVGGIGLGLRTRAFATSFQSHADQGDSGSQQDEAEEQD